MKISVHDQVAIHGLSIFDESGEYLLRVQTFDTETYLCRTEQGKRQVAAGYVIFVNNEKDLQRYLETLPDEMQLHVYPEILDGTVPDEEELARHKAFIQQQLDHRAKLRDLLAQRLK